MKSLVLFIDYSYWLEVLRIFKILVKIIFYYNIVIFDFNIVNIVWFCYIDIYIIYNIYWNVL